MYNTLCGEANTLGQNRQEALAYLARRPVDPVAARNVIGERFRIVDEIVARVVSHQTDVLAGQLASALLRLAAAAYVKPVEVALCESESDSWVRVSGACFRTHGHWALSRQASLALMAAFEGLAEFDRTDLRLPQHALGEFESHPVAFNRCPQIDGAMMVLHVWPRPVATRDEG